MKRFLSLLLALTLALALSVPAGADEYASTADGAYAGVIGGADGTTFILIDTDPATAAEAEKAQREQNLQSLGGVVGQTNVLLGDKCIAFTDAAPEVKNGRTMVPLRASLEAMGAKVEYDAASKTAVVTGEKASFTHVIGSDVITLADGSAVKMDAASYVTAANRTMIPVRFFSQVLGYDVFWDNDYKLVFLLDEETFTKDVDSSLTILNGYLAKNAKSFDPAKNYKEDMTLSGTVKVVDSIKGDRSYPYSVKASALFGRDGLSLSLSADLGKLTELLGSLADGELSEAYRAALAKPELEAVFGDRLYLKSPLLDAALDGEAGTWYASEAEESFSDLYASEYGDENGSTVGSLLYASMKQGDANHFFDSWDSTTSLASLATELLGDKTFTKSGNSYKWHFGTEELAKLMADMLGIEYTAQSVKELGIEELSIDLTLKADGSAESDGVLAINQDGEAALRLEYTSSGNATKSALKGTVQVRNVCDVTFDAAASVRATSEKPVAAPPAGSEIVELPLVQPVQS